MSRTNVYHVDDLSRFPVSTGSKTPLAFHTGQAGRTIPRWDTICLVIGLIGIWLLARPYHGIRHDNTLYALQALHAIAPESFQRELFVQYGAQDQYTMFTSFYATVIEHLGLHRGTLVLLIVGQLLWALAATLLLRSLLTGRWLWAALVVLFVSSGAYGSHRVFHVAEPFVTPRLFAESLGLLALYALLRERLLVALLAIAGAGLLHPIMALGTAAVVFVYLVLKHPRWLWVGAAGVVMVLGLAVLHIQPFIRLLQVMEPPWRHMVEWRNDSLFVSKAISDWSYLLHTSCIVLLSVAISKGRTRRLLLASLMAAWGALTINGVGGDGLSNVFILQIQPWRTLWVLQVVSSLLRSKPLANPTWHHEAWQIDHQRFHHTYKDVCRQSSGLDYIVAPIKVPGEPIGHWRPPVRPLDESNGKHGSPSRLLEADLYLYKCARYRTPGRDLIVRPLRAEALP